MRRNYILAIVRLSKKEKPNRVNQYSASNLVATTIDNSLNRNFPSLVLECNSGVHPAPDRIVMTAYSCYLLCLPYV